MERLRLLCVAAAAVLITTTGCAQKNRSSMRDSANRQAPAPVNNASNASTFGQDRIAREVRHELVMLPYYGVFDNLAYRVDGGVVTLMGQVTRPTLKSDSENVVKHVEGVTEVRNEIQVLPLSPNDDRIRIAVFRAIYGQPGLDRYALQAIPPIHIIVENGQVTLQGVVASEADKNMANLRANGVSGVFSVKNDLRLEQ